MTTRTGPSLVAQVKTLHVPPGMLALWALGQSGFILKGGQTIAYIDPYLARNGGPGIPSRQFPPPLLPHEADNAQIVFCTHEHIDHTHPETLGPLSQASPDAVFVGPANSRDMLRDAGIDDQRIIVPEVGQPQSLAGLTFTAVPAAHYDLDYDPERGFRWLGFLIELNGVTLYHSGDTVLYDGLEEQLKAQPIDVACLPVNGRDWWREGRNMVGNMLPNEAAELIARLNVDMFIPIHNDLFAENRLSPAFLAEYLDRHYPRQKYHWLQPGELYLYVK